MTIKILNLVVSKINFNNANRTLKVDLKEYKLDDYGGKGNKNIRKALRMLVAVSLLPSSSFRIEDYLNKYKNVVNTYKLWRKVKNIEIEYFKKDIYTTNTFIEKNKIKFRFKVRGNFVQLFEL